jgi:hypothetical protein
MGLAWAKMGVNAGGMGLEWARNGWTVERVSDDEWVFLKGGNIFFVCV